MSIKRGAAHLYSCYALRMDHLYCFPAKGHAQQDEVGDATGFHICLILLVFNLLKSFFSYLLEVCALFGYFQLDNDAFAGLAFRL